MSSRQLTQIETDLLKKSLNFSTTSKKLLNKDLIATIEGGVQDWRCSKWRDSCQNKLYTSKFQTFYR